MLTAGLLWLSYVFLFVCACVRTYGSVLILCANMFWPIYKLLSPAIFSPVRSVLFFSSDTGRLEQPQSEVIVMHFMLSCVDCLLYVAPWSWRNTVSFHHCTWLKRQESHLTWLIIFGSPHARSPGQWKCVMIHLGLFKHSWIFGEFQRRFEQKPRTSIVKKKRKYILLYLEELQFNILEN